MSDFPSQAQVVVIGGGVGVITSNSIHYTKLYDSPPEAGAYDYLACDSGGQALVTGIVILSVTDTTVAGHWDLRRIPWGDPEIPVGPQVGTGQLEGRVRSDTLVLELNPDAVDYNLGLVGTPARGGAIA